MLTGSGDGPKVGLAYDVGGRGDQSFNDSAALGMEKAVDELDATCTEAEAQDGEAESAREDRLRALADEGHDPIIGVGFAYSEAANVVAPDYPEVSFAVVDGFDPDGRAQRQRRLPRLRRGARAPSSSAPPPPSPPRPTTSASSVASTTT